MGTSFNEALSPQDIATMGSRSSSWPLILRADRGPSSEPTATFKPHGVTQASPEMGTSFNEALSPQDIATMGALCSLASLSRPELKRQVVDNLGFREYLEAVPEVCPAPCQLGQ